MLMTFFLKVVNDHDVNENVVNDVSAHVSGR